MTSREKYLTKIKTDIFPALILFIIFLLIFLSKLSEITPGLWGDEAALGSMIVQLKEMGGFTPFISYNLGHPTPLIYLSSLVVNIFGRSIFSLRLVSVIFGALCVPAFYFLLRRFFDKTYSILGASLLGSSYVLIIVSRFAYEISAAIFFSILGYWAIVNYAKNSSNKNLIFIGLYLSAGLYTYLAFRLVMVPLLLISVYLIWKKSKNKIKSFAIFFTAILALSLPLIIYGVNHPQEFNQRVNSLNVFNQNLPREEVVNELVGASKRTLGMFLTTGDPNLRQNPSGTTPYDPFTVAFFVLGIIYLFKTNKKLGIFAVTIISIVLAAEIITLERIPEAKYYGLGHPNTLRFAIITPVIIFGAVWGIKYFEEQLKKVKLQSELRFVIVQIFTLIIVIFNLHKYFNQPEQPWIYYTNFVVHMEAIKVLNEELPPEVVLSSDFYQTEHFKFFLDSRVEAKEYPSPIDCEFPNLTEDLYFLGLQDVRHCSQADFDKLFANEQYQATALNNRWGVLDALVISKRQ